jgi:hypothetical protein
MLKLRDIFDKLVVYQEKMGHVYEEKTDQEKIALLRDYTVALRMC